MKTKSEIDEIVRELKALNFDDDDLSRLVLDAAETIDELRRALGWEREDDKRSD